MLIYVITFLFAFSFITASFRSTMDQVCLSLLASPEQAMELAIGMGCSLCLWNGIMALAENCGILSVLSRWFSPVIRFLFPTIPKDSPAIPHICGNLTANLLGLGAAAVPSGIQAVREIQRASPSPDIAQDNSILLILLNTASLQLIPTATAQLRLQAGSSAPMEILPAVWMASCLSVLCGIFVSKIMGRLCTQKALPNPSSRRKKYEKYF